MTPEQKARKLIDQRLEASGWKVQDYREINISAGLGVAVREFPLKTGDADYMLYADMKAIGVVEAKPVGHTLTGVETQSGKYLDGLPDPLPHYHLPLPFAYESTGEVTQFTNAREQHARSRPVFSFHRPEELIRLANQEHAEIAIEHGQTRASLLCHSILKQAFEGKLVPQVPYDDPAEAWIGRSQAAIKSSIQKHKGDSTDDIRQHRERSDEGNS